MTVVLALVLVTAFLDRRVASSLGRHLGRLTRARRPLRASSDEVLLAELTALGLSAGLSFSAAVEAAADHVSEETGQSIRRTLRSQRVGSDTGAPLFALADRALFTGAPLLASIEGYARSLRSDERSAATERARRLPVKLLFPLALLILPGFLLLTIGPAFLAGIARLGL